MNRISERPRRPSMLKRVLLASVAGLSLTTSTPSAAKADPITATIVGAMGSAFAAGTTLGAIATFVVNSALYSAASLGLSKLLGGKNKQAVTERQASVTSLSLGEVPRTVVFGMRCLGGSLTGAYQ